MPKFNVRDVVVSKGKQTNCTCIKTQPIGTKGYVTATGLGSTNERFTVRWENGKGMSQCEGCCDKLHGANYVVGTKVKFTRMECPICGGITQSHWVGEIIERITDDKGLRFRIKIPDQKHPKGRILWRGCPLCVAPVSGIKSTDAALRQQAAKGKKQLDFSGHDRSTRATFDKHTRSGKKPLKFRMDM